MTRYHSALAVATVALSPSRASALSLFPKRGPASRAASTISARTPVSFVSRNRSKFLPFRAVTEAKEGAAFFADEVPEGDDGSDSSDDEKSWPVKPPSPPDTPPPAEAEEADGPPAPAAAAVDLYTLPSVPAFEPIDVDLSFLKPIYDPTISKNVPRSIVFGAFLNGAFLSLLSSFLLFGPLSLLFPPLLSWVIAASVGILTAFLSIIEGAVGEFFRSVGKATVDVGGGVLDQVKVWTGEREVDKVANALLEKPKAVKATKKKNDTNSMPIKEGLTGEEAEEVRNARLSAADEAAKSLGKKQQPAVAVVDAAPAASVDYDAAARLAYEASSSTGDFEAFKAQYLIDTSAMIAQKFQDAIAADEEEAKAKETAAAAKAAEAAAAAEEEARLKTEEEAQEAKLQAKEQEAQAADDKAKEEEARAAKMAAQLKAEEEEEARAWNAAQEKAKQEEASRATKMQARLKAQEEARIQQVDARAREVEAERAAKDQARLQADEMKARAAAEEEARLAEMKKIAEEEDRLKFEEQAAAAREAVRLMEEQEALMDDDVDDDDELDDEDWEASVRLANELQGGMPLPFTTTNGNIKGDIIDDIGDDMLQYEIDNLSQEEEDALGKAAREAVRKYEEDMAMKQGAKESVRSAWDSEMVVPSSPAAAVVESFSAGSKEPDPAPQVKEASDYSKMTVVQLKDILRSKGLKVGGKKAVLIERLEESS